MNGQVPAAKDKKFMEKFSETPLEDWINSDSELSSILKKIELEGKTDIERARIAFHVLAEKYSLPKYPDDVFDRETVQVGDFHFYDPISLYEVLGKIKFSEPNQTDIKSEVLMAVFLVKNKFEPIFSEELDEYLGDDELFGFAYKGIDVEVELIPVKVGESWFDLGCTFFTKDID